MTRLVVLIAIFVSFTVYSLGVTVERGYWGFLHLALSDDWGGQIFLDLCIGLTIALGGLRRDAKAMGITFWPYLIATPFLGSISPLAYLIHRQVEEMRAASTPAVAAAA